MSTDLETRVARLEDTNAIQALGILYGYVMDERDEDGIRRIFCDDATLRSQDGVFAATGMNAVSKFLRWASDGTPARSGASPMLPIEP